MPTLINKSDLQFTLAENVTGKVTYQLRVQDNGYPSADSVRTFTIESKQFKAQLSATPTQPCTGEDVQFTSTSPREGISFLWNFGEGATPQTFTGHEPAPVVYATSGAKTAKLKITLGAQSDSASINLTVNTSPVSSFIAGSDVYPVYDTVYFYNTSTGGVSYEWDFGDGTPVLVKPNTDLVKHKYAAANNQSFIPQLTARNGNCVDVFTKTITFIDALPPVIIESNFPTSYDISETVPVTLRAQDEQNGLKKAVFYYRSISNNQWRSRNLDPNGDTFTTSISETMGDQIGLEYYFDVFNNLNIKRSSTHAYAYLRFNTGLDVPGIIFGTSVDKYQIISIPLKLDNSAVDGVLNQLPPPDINVWRLFHYTSTRLMEYPADFENFERGKGYWLISKNPVTINTGSGATSDFGTFNHYSIPLRQGWTQIGNPYVFDVSWTDIIAVNEEIVDQIGELRVYKDGNFQDAQTLERFSGGFVFANTSGLELKIPVSTGSTKYTKSEIMWDEPSSGNWKVTMLLTAGSLVNDDIGFGMHTEALASKDKFDHAATPRFFNYLEANFEHPEFFYPNFSTDIVPVADNHIWDFTVESNLENELVTLQWEKRNPQLLGSRLKLFDTKTLTSVDMTAANQYAFFNTGPRNFKILYGDDAFIENAMFLNYTALGDCYPNPFTNRTLIPVFLKGNEEGTSNVELSVYTIDGRKVATLVKGTIRNGFHEFEWHSESPQGAKTGVYLYTLKNVTDGTTQTKRMIQIQ